MLALMWALGVQAQPSGFAEPCRQVGEARFVSPTPGRCAGTWNIYASIAGGWTWYSDKMGTDPAARRLDQEAARMQERLRRCGLVAHVSLSNWFDTFRPDLVVVHSNPHPGKAEAAAELRQAKQCGIDGYSKASPYQFSGRD